MRPLNDCIKEDKSKADEMFEKANCRKNYEDKYMANYETFYRTIINFDKDKKTVRIWDDAELDIQELQAINEKCKELGWL